MTRLAKPSQAKLGWLDLANIAILHTYLLMKKEQSVLKHRHIKFKRQGITQKKEYNMIDILTSLITSL